MRSTSPAKCRWYPFIDEPLIEGVKYAPQFSSPQVILPYESCDGKWHMFFHSWIGIHHFVSDSGIAWEPRRVVEFRGKYPSVLRDGESYYLVYEKHDHKRRTGDKNKSGSTVEMKISTDLVTWSRPRVLLKGSDVGYASDYRSNSRLSNPQLVKLDNSFRLYFGASSVKLPDSDYVSPRYFGYADSANLLGPYTVGKESLIIESEGDSEYSNMAAGSVKIVKVSDKFYAFQCGVYWDNAKRKTRSAIRILESDNGIDFSECNAKPVLTTSDEGWTSSYIGTCDAHYKKDEDCWYCYYSGRGGKSRKFEKESIGLMIGQPI